MSDVKVSLADVRDRASMRCLNPSRAMSEAIADRQALLAAVEGVLAVHVRGVGSSQGYTPNGYGYVEPYCAGCEASYEYAVPWPCATVRAITARVRIEEA